MIANYLLYPHPKIQKKCALPIQAMRITQFNNNDNPNMIEDFPLQI
nr:MAG TPA: hypothetical protein [Crassvirales sp.]